MKQPVIIIGMHHSGTGLVSEILHHGGIFMGNDLNENAESDLFHKLNCWCFQQAGATWDNPYNFNFINDGFSGRIAKALKKHLKGSSLKPYLDSARRRSRRIEKFDFDWGFSDPLNTFTIDLWKKIFSDAIILHVYRNPLDVAASLKTKNDEFRESVTGGIFKGFRRRSRERKLSPEKLFEWSLRTNNLAESFKLWSEYTEKALNIEENTGFKTHHICFEDLVQDFRAETEKLFLNLGFVIPDGSLLEVEEKMGNEKCYSFLKDDILNEYYQTIKNQSLITQLNYHDIK